jgi:pimeloyl-ACP methyl ester carboxylesterase
MKCVSLGDTEIEYSERGAGEPLLLVHAGLFANWFAPMAESHALDGFRVIRVRRAGYGRNAPKRPLTLQDHANHLAALAAHLGLEAVHLVGHSSSALIGLDMAIDHPKVVRSLILMEPAPCGPLQAPAAAELFERFLGPAMSAFADGNLEGAFDSFMRGVCGDKYREVIEKSLGRAGYEQAVRESDFFFRDETGAAMHWQFGPAKAARVQQPVLIVEGAEGRKQGPFSQQVTELTQKLLPHAEVELIEGVNHALPLQNPDGVAQVVASYARRHPIAIASVGTGHASV